MRPDYRANLIHLGWCKSRYLLQHHMLGLTTEQKLLITPTPRDEGKQIPPSQTQSKARWSRYKLLQLQWVWDQARSELWASSAAKTQNPFPLALPVWCDTCVKELGAEGEGFWGFVFFQTEELFHPCQHVDFVQKERRQEIFFLKPSAPHGSIPAEGGCVHHRDPWVLKTSLIHSLYCRRANLESWVGISTEPCSPHPAETKGGLIKHGMWEKIIPQTLVSLPS